MTTIGAGREGPVRATVAFSVTLWSGLAVSTLGSLVALTETAYALLNLYFWSSFSYEGGAPDRYTAYILAGPIIWLGGNLGSLLLVRRRAVMASVIGSLLVTGWTGLLLWYAPLHGWWPST